MRRNDRHVLPAVLAFVLVNALAGFSVGCARNAPPDLAPADLKVWQANEIQVAFGAVQRTAISLNGIEKCDAAVPPVCAPLLSDANTRTVIGITEDVVLTLRATPEGWKGIANQALLRLSERLTTEGRDKLSAYLGMVRAVVEGL